MKPGVCAVVLAVLGLALPSAASTGAESEHVHGCMSPGKAREILIEQKLVAPFRALGEVARSGQGEAVGVQLCLLGDDYVYDVTLLRRDGHVSHTLVNARNGVTTAARNGK